jgi:hypothetical protein
MHLAPPVDQLVEDGKALRQPVGHARSGCVEEKQLQFLAEFPMVTQRGLLQALDMFPEGFRMRKGQGLYALQHGALLITTPVGSGDLDKLEAVRRNLVTGRDMRAATEIDEVSVLIKGDRCGRGLRLRLAVFIEATLHKPFQDFEFIRLRREQGATLRGIDLAIVKGMPLVKDGLHAGFDGRQVLGDQGTWQGKVVVESILNRRTAGKVHRPFPVKVITNGLGQDMCQTVAQTEECGIHKVCS